MNCPAARSTSTGKQLANPRDLQNAEAYALRPRFIHHDVHALIEVCRQLCLLHVSDDTLSAII